MRKQMVVVPEDGRKMDIKPKGLKPGNSVLVSIDGQYLRNVSTFR